MNVIRVTEEWQKAGVHFVRAKGMCTEFKISLDMEFSDDTKDSLYVLAFDKHLPVSTCRIRILDNQIGKIERVCTIQEYRSQGYGAAVIAEAEMWIKDMGAKKVIINAREEALKFYERIGYVTDSDDTSHSEDIADTEVFHCIEVKKSL